MEHQTSFDLNLAIQRWRDDLARSAALRTENMNELESHLRDSIDSLLARELSDEEVFLIATRRIGGTQKLEQEFGKVNAAGVWFDRCLWVLVAVQLWYLLTSSSTLLMSVASLLCNSWNDILPVFGLHKIGEDWVQTALAIIFSPLLVALGAVLVWRYFIWPKRRGSAWLQNLLRQPGKFALTLFLLCVTMQIAAILAFHAWYVRATIPSVQYLRVPSFALWAGLTYFITRKRLRSSLA
jgi:hypothetical protein